MVRGGGSQASGLNLIDMMLPLDAYRSYGYELLLLVVLDKKGMLITW
jgi:hypothetical protein